MWIEYQNTFPLRYIEHGYFDEYIKDVVSRLKPRSILDIGGGAHGTEALKESSAEVYLLDPYIDIVPGWMSGKVDWGTNKKFDLIVARGSINYLTEQELSKITFMLEPDGVFIANTFLEPPKEEWVERGYVNQLGQKGIERSRYNKESKKVEHELINESGEVIKHEFFYRSKDSYGYVFPKIQFIPYKSNSVVLYLVK